jgi:cell division protein FtsA
MTMDTIDKHIVAIDLGTSKIALTVAKVEGNDVQIIYYKETESAGIRYSSVFNVKNVTEALASAIALAEDELNIKITQAVVGMPKYPIKKVTANAELDGRGEDTDITEEDIDSLKSFAQDSYPLEDPEKEAIFGAVAQSFSDGENFQIIEQDIIGMTSDVLEGNFKIFIGKKSDLNKVDQVMSRCGITAIQKYFTADTTAKAVLNSSEMENGVALVDFGAGCTSVSIYHGKIMRHYASIPFGGKSITDDIKGEAQISQKLAENIKIAFGACMPDKLQSLSEKVIQIRSNSSEGDKSISVKYLSEIITARVEEIMMAVLYEIEQSGFADMLRSGIVITGGVAQCANLCNFINDISGYKVRTGYPKHLFSHQGCEGITDTTAATSIGLLLAAKNSANVNCIIANEENEKVTNVVLEEPEDNTPRNIFGEPIEEKPAPKPQKNTSGDKPKTETTKPKPTWKPFADAKGWMDDLFKSMNNDNV